MNTNFSSKPFVLPPLPFDEGALAPAISAATFGFHYGKHHKAYVDNLNGLVANTPYADMKLEEVIKASVGKPTDQGIFNNAAQVWNHTFFWHSLTPKTGAPGKELQRAIERDFGDLEQFKKAFATAGVGQFGSGWVWLVNNGGKLTIEKTSNAMTPLAEGKNALLTIDVWEHAYYLDYQNRRGDFLRAVLDSCLNWNFATENFARA